MYQRGLATWRHNVSRALAVNTAAPQRAYTASLFAMPRSITRCLRQLPRALAWQPPRAHLMAPLTAALARVLATLGAHIAPYVAAFTKPCAYGETRLSLNVVNMALSMAQARRRGASAYGR